MTSSEPTVTPPTLGECVVCGTPTHLRCSKCSEGGINWMCFCSVEHQKMVYKIHKRVCGTNPFKWPALNDAEVEEAYRLRNCQIKTDTSETLLEGTLESFKSTAPKHLVDRYLANGVDAWFQLYLTSLTPNGTVSIQGDAHGVRIKLTQMRLQRQKASFSKEIKLSMMKEWFRSVLDFPLDYFSAFTDMLLKQLPPHIQLSSNFLHRLIILFGTLQSRLKSVLTQERSPTWSLQPLLEYQRTLIMSSGVGEMTGLPDVDSEKAHKILEERIDSTFDLIGGPR